MKKLFFIAAAMFAAVSFSACSDDDDKVDISLLYGTWQEVRSYGYALEDGEKVDEWDETLDGIGQYSFNEYGGGSYHNEFVDWDIRYTQNGNTLQLTCSDKYETFNYTWTIEELTNTQMKATQYSKKTVNKDSDTFVYEEYDTMIFRRVN